MSAHRLSRAEARRIAVRAQLLDAKRPTDLHEVVRDLTFLQIDPTAAIAPAADFVAWSRLGVYPSDVSVPSVDEARRIKNERRLRSLGIARVRSTPMPIEPVDVGEVGEPAVVDDVPGEWRVHPEALGRGFEGRTALLSPFDRLAYDRVRSQELFDFDYTLEMYKPREKRRWGYFALPVLHGDRLVGKVDATADRKRSVLDVHAVHEDVRFTKAMTKAVTSELEDLAAWLGLEDVARP